MEFEGRRVCHVAWLCPCWVRARVCVQRVGSWHPLGRHIFAGATSCCDGICAPKLPDLVVPPKPLEAVGARAPRLGERVVRGGERGHVHVLLPRVQPGGGTAQFRVVRPQDGMLAKFRRGDDVQHMMSLQGHLVAHRSKGDHTPPTSWALKLFSEAHGSVVFAFRWRAAEAEATPTEAEAPSPSRQGSQGSHDGGDRKSVV